MGAEIDWSKQRKVFPPETEWTFFLDGEMAPVPGKPHHYLIPSLKATGATAEEARAKIEAQIPPGQKIWSTHNNYRMTEEEMYGEEA